MEILSTIDRGLRHLGKRIDEKGIANYRRNFADCPHENLLSSSEWYGERIEYWGRASDQCRKVAIGSTVITGSLSLFTGQPVIMGFALIQYFQGICVELHLRDFHLRAEAARQLIQERNRLPTFR